MGLSDIMQVKHLPQVLEHKCPIKIIIYYDFCCYQMLLTAAGLSLWALTVGVRIPVVAVLLDKGTKFLSLRNCLSV